MPPFNELDLLFMNLTFVALGAAIVTAIVWRYKK